eukprot:CAMPEP_0114279798 /NCGR_PEP_ID=MMETSP0059-20121206/2090_1 /TAXON_ID=36894 /ORGANISM="Pyramimonas parkeae, Strain CCMP726" /LENGTH=51 /DNA_ID=CAMNT_0001400143 /DNA_START=480 /DNA_END=635 /DNA_ORIENTATION=+
MTRSHMLLTCDQIPLESIVSEGTGCDFSVAICIQVDFESHKHACRVNGQDE